MRSALLRGPEQLGLGHIACIAEGPAAIALCQGGARKRYAHKHPNEDCVAFCLGSGGGLLVVADGHGGVEAAAGAVEEIVRSCGPGWTGALASGDWRALATGAVRRAERAAVQQASRAGSPHARTTLGLLLVRPQQDWWAWASVGDSHVFRVEATGAQEIGAPDPGEPVAFLGSPTRVDDREAPPLRCDSGAIGAARALSLVTDGLSERGIGVADPAGAVAEAVAAAAEGDAELRPLAAARGIVERAIAAQREQKSGDNVAAALYHLGDGEL